MSLPCLFDPVLISAPLLTLCAEAVILIPVFVRSWVLKRVLAFK